MFKVSVVTDEISSDIETATVPAHVAGQTAAAPASTHGR